MTSEGFISHEWNQRGFFMPVKLAMKKNITVKEAIEFQPPLRNKRGKLVFALPGGESFIGA